MDTCNNLGETPENHAVLNKRQPQKNAHCAITFTSCSWGNKVIEMEGWGKIIVTKYLLGVHKGLNQFPALP